MAGSYAVESAPIEWLGLSTEEWKLIEPFWPAGFMRQTDFTMAGEVAGQQYEIRSPRPECGIEALSWIAIKKCKAEGHIIRDPGVHDEMRAAMTTWFKRLLDMSAEEFKAELVAYHLSPPLT